MAEYARNPSMPFFFWLRFLTGQKLVTLHRRHLGVKMRNADQEVALYHGRCRKRHRPRRGPAPGARHPSQRGRHSRRDEAPRAGGLEQHALLEREVLALRHFEQLSRAEIAEVFGISEAAAAKRYLRALERLKHILGQLPGGLDGVRP